MNRKTYINPNVFNKQFLIPSKRSIHVNPNFSRPCNVHFNPRIVNLNNAQNGVPPTNSISNVSNSQQSNTFSWHRERKINNAPSKVPLKKPTPTVYLSPSKRKLVRKIGNANVMISNRVWKKEDIFKYAINMPKHQTKFKVDKRVYQAKRTKISFNIENLFPKSTFKYYKTFSKQNQSPKKPILQKTKADSSNKKLVNIGGISYRVTSKKLTRTTNLKNQSGKKPEKTIINVQGDKYLLSDNGTKLCRLSTSPHIRRRERLDFGGVTFRKLTDNVLIRTNSHKTRNVLAQAKQRSIACLAAKRRKINSPCLFYRKFGRCQRNEQKKCIYVHDKKNVDLCKGYLRGNCKDTNCLLSHDAVYEKVATCQYYLEGKCFREDCPYLHVKVSGKAEICREFLEGYCPSGEKCIKRHTNICPDFEKVGICKKGKNCPYPHSKLMMNKVNLSGSQFKFNKKTKRKSESFLKKRKCKEEKKIDNPVTVTRYYVPESVPGTSQQGLVPARDKISSLPSFIAFSDS